MERNSFSNKYFQKSVLRFFVFLAIALSAVGGAYASNVTVSNFDDLQSNISQGTVDTIYVNESFSFDDTLDIDKSVELQALGDITLEGLIEVSADDVVIKGFTIESSVTNGGQKFIDVQADNLVFNNNVVNVLEGSAGTGGSSFALEGTNNTVSNVEISWLGNLNGRGDNSIVFLESSNGSELINATVNGGRAIADLGKDDVVIFTDVNIDWNSNDGGTDFIFTGGSDPLSGELILDNVVAEGDELKYKASGSSNEWFFNNKDDAVEFSAAENLINLETGEWIVGGGYSIQDAINASKAGDTILVQDGTYEEGLNVDVENLTLISENKHGAKIKNNNIVGGGDSQVLVTGNNVTVDGFVIEVFPANGQTPGGIALNGNNSAALNNIVSDENNGNRMIAGSGDNILILNNTIINGGLGYSGVGSATFTNNTIEGSIADEEAFWAGWPNMYEGNLTIKENDFTGVDYQSPVEETVKLTVGTTLQDSGASVNGIYSNGTNLNVIFNKLVEDNEGVKFVEFDAEGKFFSPIQNLNTENYYFTIQAAIEAASAGDTILVGEGVYEEDLTVNVNSLTLKSKELHESVVEGKISIEADNVTLNGFKVIDEGGSKPIVKFDSTTGSQIINNDVEQTDLTGSNPAIGMLSNQGFGDVLIKNNTVYGAIGMYPSDGSNVVIEENTINWALSEGIWINGEGFSQADYDLTLYNNSVSNSNQGNLGSSDIKMDYIPNSINNLTSLTNLTNVAVTLLEQNNADTIQLWDNNNRNSNGEVLLLPGDSIQAAINAADAGDMILVGEGTYEENVIVNKSVTLKSTEGSAINGSVKFESPNSVLDGFTVLEGSTILGQKAGAYLSNGANNVVIKNNNFIRENSYSLFRGVLNEIGSAENVSIENNTFTGWATGVYVQRTSAELANNKFVSNNVGMSIDEAENVSVINNEFDSNEFEGIGVGSGVQTLSIDSNEFKNHSTHIRSYDSLFVGNEIKEIFENNQFDEAYYIENDSVIYGTAQDFFNYANNSKVNSSNAHVSLFGSTAPAEIRSLRNCSIIYNLTELEIRINPCEVQHVELEGDNSDNINVQEHRTTPSILVGAFNEFNNMPTNLENTLNKYFKIEMLTNQIQEEGIQVINESDEPSLENQPFMQLKFPLSELPNNLQENTISFNRYNETSQEWETIETFIEDGYIVANITEFSTWGISGEEQQPQSSGGGGGGSSIDMFVLNLPEDRDETFELNGNDRVQVELDGNVYIFYNEDNSNSQSTLSFEGDDYTFEVGDEQIFDLNNDGQDDLRIILDDSRIFEGTFNFLAVEEDETQEESNEEDETVQDEDDSLSGSGSEFNVTQTDNNNNNEEDDTPTTTQDETSEDNLGEGQVDEVQAPAGGFIQANAPTIIGGTVGLVIILAIAGYFFFVRK
ncbi:MAG: right-handed parallel beta-helix repeat-containing protein [Candidatus Nanoarchaeia archaeon]